MFIGLSLDATRQDMCRAVLEGIALRTAQVITTMDAQAGSVPEVSINGRLSSNAYFCQFLADALGRTVVISATPDTTTSLGTAWIAMLGAGLVAEPCDLLNPGRITDPAIVEGTWLLRRSTSCSQRPSEGQEVGGIPTLPERCGAIVPILPVHGTE